MLELKLLSASLWGSAGDGGAITLTAGKATKDDGTTGISDGGSIAITAGASTGNTNSAQGTQTKGIGGGITLTAGASVKRTGGSLTFVTGASSGTSSGAISMKTADGGTAGVSGPTRRGSRLLGCVGRR